MLLYLYFVAIFCFVVIFYILLLYFVLLLYFLCYALQKLLMKIHSFNYYFVDISNSLQKISDIMPSFDSLHFLYSFWHSN